MPNFRSLLFLNSVIKHLKREGVRESAEDSCYNEAYKIIAINLLLLSRAWVGKLQWQGQYHSVKKKKKAQARLYLVFFQKMPKIRGGGVRLN